jgi:hypothetical protein
MQHHIANLCIGTLKPTPTAILTGAPTIKVPKKPSPTTPYFSQILCAKFGFFIATSTLGWHHKFQKWLSMQQ